MSSSNPVPINQARLSIAGQSVSNGPNQKRVYESIVDLIANPDNPTPMVRLSGRYNPEPGFELFIKLESFNPFGSIKDRTALYLLRGTHLAEGQVLAEPTAGNTGIALAALANAQGSSIELAVPEATPTAWPAPHASARTCSKASSSGPWMNWVWFSTRWIASSISGLMEAYWAFRSTSGIIRLSPPVGFEHRRPHTGPQGGHRDR